MQQGAYQSLRRISDSAPGGKGFKQCILNCGSITRRFSGLPALNISITRFPEPDPGYRNTSLTRARSANIKAMGARVEKLARPAMKLTELEKERYIHDFICEHVHYDKLKSPTPMRSSDLGTGRRRLRGHRQIGQNSL